MNHDGSDREANGQPAGDSESESRMAAVSAFLQCHPKFLLQHEDALSSQVLPRDKDGKVVSFAGKQNELLRERYLELRHSMSKKIQWATENERLFDSTRRLVLDLITAQNLRDLVAVLNASLQDDFDTDASSLLLIGDPDEEGDARIVALDKARQAFPHLLDNAVPICGILRDEELEFLFPANNEVGSAVVAPISGNPLAGLLAIGSHDPEHFRSGMGTMFLSYICDVLERLLPRFHDSEIPQ